ncbi:MAG TPA: type IV secretion system DNA-binding domain-containing protein [Candidatus Paceibacterota bacterium]|nr:type IV secretion system DNA-binding domain-containing protein [Candidatus Paceibacterota bacterium]
MMEMTSDDKVTYFAETDARNKRVKFGIKAKDRTRHVYIIGKTGMGKSTLLENMAVQDIQGGEGCCFIDPHGKTAELLLNYVPENRLKDVLYFAPFDVEHPIAFNVMEDVGYDKRHLVVSGLMSTFKKIWADAWSARMEYILSNTLLALLEYPGATLLGVNKMLSDKDYRKKVVDNIKDPAVKSFWVDEFAKYTDRFAAEATPAIQNKIGQFTNNPLIRNIIGQPKSSFDLRKMMDDRKILIVNLSKGRVGESNANLLGAMLITKIYLAAMSRADVSDKIMKTLPNFYLYVDEFQSFANESFADILSEARKYKLNLTMAHQYIEQMSEEVRAAVFGNVGTMIVFRVGSYDAEVLEKEFAPQFTAEDIVNLGFAQIYLRLMIDGIGSQPFSATTLPPIPEPAVTFKEQVVQGSRAQFTQVRPVVEELVRMQTLGATPDRPLATMKAEPRDRTSTAERADRPMPPAPSPMPPREPRREERRDDRREDRRDDRRLPQENNRRHETPPMDASDGFHGFDAIKAMVTPRPLQNSQSQDQKRPNDQRPEKKGVTEESRNDLRQALASIAKPPAAPKEAPKQEAKKEAAPPAPPVAPRPPELKHSGPANEVPEDVLNKLLDM